MLAGPDGPDPEIKSRCNGALRLVVGLASKLPTKESGPEQTEIQAIESLGKGREVRTHLPALSQERFSHVYKHLREAGRQ